MRPRRETYPALMTFKEKHDNEVYIVNSSEEIHRLAVAKIRERFQYGYYAKAAEYEHDLNRSIDQLIAQSDIPAETAPRTVAELEALTGNDTECAAALFNMDVVTFNALPASMGKSLLEKANSFRTRLHRVIGNAADDIQSAQEIELIVHSEQAEKLTKAFRGREYNLALWILDARQDYEYEEYDIDQPRVAPTEEELAATRVDPKVGE